MKDERIKMKTIKMKIATMNNDIENSILIYYDHNFMCDYEIVLIFLVIIKIWNLAIYHTTYFKCNFFIFKQWYLL